MKKSDTKEYKNEAENEKDFFVPVGHLFREQREASGIRIDVAAQNLFLDQATLEALENDDFQKIGSPVFIRGYARNYARYLGLDVDQIGAVLESHIQKMESPSTRKVQFLDANKKTRSELDYSKANFNLKDRKKSVLWPYTLIATIFLFLILFVGYRYFSQEEVRGLKNKQIPLESIPLPQQGEETVIKLPAPQLDQSSDIVDLLPEIIDNEPLAEPFFQQQQLENTEKDALWSNDSETFLAPNERKIYFLLHNTSWLRLVDAQGKEITSRVYSPEERPEFIIEAPIEVVIGNATDVSLEVNGEAYDFQKFMYDNVARFSIP